MWPLATIVEDLDLLGGVVGPLGEPLHVLGGDLVPGHRHHLGGPRVRAVVGITDNQLHYPAKCCASPTHGTPHLMSWLFLNSMYHILYYYHGIMDSTGWRNLRKCCGKCVYWRSHAGLQVILTQQIYPRVSMH